VQTVNSEVVFARVDDRVFDKAQVAAVAFLARYNGRTLDAYRQDCRNALLPPRRNASAVSDSDR
jgi:hypothetical protein